MAAGRLPQWLPRCPRQAPLGLIGAVILVFGFELHVERHAIDYQGGGHWSYRIASGKARSEAKRDQILYFGDSLMRLGVVPTVVEAETGLRGYNFAQTGGQAPGSYFLCRQAFANGARPRAIVVDFFPKLLAEDPKFNEENYPFLATLRDGLDYALTRRDPTEFARFAVRAALPSARSHDSLRFALTSALNPQPGSVKFEIQKSIRNWKLNRGAEVTPCRPGVVDDLATWEKGYFPEFRVDPTNQVYLERLVDLAARFQTPVFWLLPPYQPELQARCERSGFDRAHEDFVRRMLARHPNLRVLDARHSGFPPEFFFDLHHLGREGAAVLSSDLGHEVLAALGESKTPTRWRNLPPFRMRLSPVPIEHVDESRLALHHEHQQKRLR